MKKRPVAKRLLLDATALVDLHDERRAGVRGRAHKRLEAYPDRAICFSVLAAGELAAGLSSQKEAAAALRGSPEPVTLAIALHGGELQRKLVKQGKALSRKSDLWIAATADYLGYTLMTRDGGLYARIPGLSVLPY